MELFFQYPHFNLGIGEIGFSLLPSACTENTKRSYN